MEGQKRNIYQFNVYERKILKIIFLFATFPVLIVILFFFGLFSDLIYTYIRSDVATDFVDRFLLLVALLVLYYLFFSRILFGFVHRLAGAYQRILRELDEIIAGTKKSHLHLRKGDYAQELIDRINQLINKLA